MVSNCRNKIHQTSEWPFRDSLLCYKREGFSILRTNLRYRSNSAPEEAFISTSDADTNGDNVNAYGNPVDDEDESECGGYVMAIPPTATSGLVKSHLIYMATLKLRS